MQGLAAFFPHLLSKAAQDPEAAVIVLRELWPQLAGEQLAQRTSPSRLEGKTLILQVEDAVWQRELGKSEATSLLLSSINSFWGQRLVERIDARIRPNGGP